VIYNLYLNKHLWFHAIYSTRQWQFLPAVIIHKFKEGSTWHISSLCEASPKIERASPSENRTTASIKAKTKWVLRCPPQKQHILLCVMLYVILFFVMLYCNVMFFVCNVFVW
jgi:hypothetical protein